MPRSRKIFLFFAALFFLMIAYLIFDVSRRTTFPGSKPRIQNELNKQRDSVKTDSAKAAV